MTNVELFAPLFFLSQLNQQQNQAQSLQSSHQKKQQTSQVALQQKSQLVYSLENILFHFCMFSVHFTSFKVNINPYTSLEQLHHYICMKLVS